MIYLQFNTISSTQKYAEDLVKSLINGHTLCKYWQVKEYEQIAFENNQDAKQSFCILTKNQTSGIGRMNRQWIGEVQDGKNLYTSFCYNKNDIECEVKFIPYYASLAVFNTLQQILTRCNCNAKLNIKWPNDILLNSCKICGILTQSFGDWIVVGVGINIANHPKDINLIYKASSLSEFVNDGDLHRAVEQLTTNKLLGKVDLTVKIAYLIQQNLESNFAISFTRIREKILANSFKLGEYIKVGGVNGIFKTIDLNGNIIVEEGGVLHSINFGDVS